MEHRFITPSDGFVRAIAICRQKFLKCCSDTVIGALLNHGVKQNGNVEAGITQVGITIENATNIILKPELDVYTQNINIYIWTF